MSEVELHWDKCTCGYRYSFFLFFPSLGVSFNSVYTQIWRVLLHLAADPFPEVSDLAMKVLNSIAYKVSGVPALFVWRSLNLDFSCSLCINELYCFIPSY